MGYKKRLIEAELEFILYGGFPKLYDMEPKLRWKWFVRYVSTEYGEKLYPVEVKAGAQINANELRGLGSFMDAASNKIPFAIVLHRSDTVHFIKKNILGVPITLLY